MTDRPIAALFVRADSIYKTMPGVDCWDEAPESTLWSYMGLPLPGRGRDAYGGYTIEVRQCDHGHRAEKLTWLYVVGSEVDELPDTPPRSEPTGVIKPQRGVPRTLPIVTKREREATPPAFARWLVDLARRCRVREELAA